MVDPANESFDNKAADIYKLSPKLKCILSPIAPWLPDPSSNPTSISKIIYKKNNLDL